MSGSAGSYMQPFTRSDSPQSAGSSGRRKLAGTKGHYYFSSAENSEIDEEYIDARWTEEELRQYIISLNIISLPSEFQILLFLEDAMLAGISKHPWIGRRDNSGKLQFYNTVTNEKSWKHPHEWQLEKLAIACRQCLGLESSARQTYIRTQQDTWTSESKAHSSGWVPKMSRSKQKQYFHRPGTSETVWENPAEIATMMNNFRVTALGWLLEDDYCDYLRGSSSVKIVDSLTTLEELQEKEERMKKEKLRLLDQEAIAERIQRSEEALIERLTRDVGTDWKTDLRDIKRDFFKTLASADDAISKLQAQQIEKDAERVRKLEDSQLTYQHLHQPAVEVRQQQQTEKLIKKIRIAQIDEMADKKQLLKEPLLVDTEPERDTQIGDALGLVLQKNAKLAEYTEFLEAEKEKQAFLLQDRARIAKDEIDTVLQKSAKLSDDNLALEKKIQAEVDVVTRAFEYEQKAFVTRTFECEQECEEQARVLWNTKLELRASTEETRKVKHELAQALGEMRILSKAISRLEDERETQGMSLKSTTSELRESAEETRKIKHELAQALLEVQSFTGAMVRLEQEKETQAELGSVTRALNQEAFRAFVSEQEAAMSEQDMISMRTKLELGESAEETRKLKHELAQASGEMQILSKAISRLEDERETQGMSLKSTKLELIESAEETRKTKHELAQALQEVQYLYRDFSRLEQEKEKWEDKALRETQQEKQKWAATVLQETQHLRRDFARLEHEKETQAVVLKDAKHELAQAVQEGVEHEKEMRWLTTEVARLEHEKETQEYLLQERAPAAKDELNLVLQKTTKLTENVNDLDGEKERQGFEMQRLNKEIARLEREKESQGFEMQRLAKEIARLEREKESQGVQEWKLRESAEETRNAKRELAQALQEKQVLTTEIARLEFEKASQEDSRLLLVQNQNTTGLLKEELHLLRQDDESKRDQWKAEQSRWQAEFEKKKQEEIQLLRQDHEKKQDKWKAEQSMWRRELNELKEKEQEMAKSAFGEEAMTSMISGIVHGLQAEALVVNVEETDCKTSNEDSRRDHRKCVSVNVKEAGEKVSIEEELVAQDHSGITIRPSIGGHGGWILPSGTKVRVKDYATVQDHNTNQPAEYYLVSAIFGGSTVEGWGRKEDFTKLDIIPKHSQEKMRAWQELPDKPVKLLKPPERKVLGKPIEETVTDEMEATIEISIEEAAARERLRLYYEEAGLSFADYEVFQRLLDLTESREAREQMLAKKNKHLHRYLESIVDILEPLRELKALVNAALDFEAFVNVEQNRFSGNAVHFLDEEKFRRSFACRFPALVDAIIGNISIFESREKQKFMYHGVELRLVLKAIRGQRLELIAKLGDESGLAEVSALLHIVKEQAETARYRFRTGQSPYTGASRARSLPAGRHSSPKHSKDWRRYTERSDSVYVAHALNEVSSRRSESAHELFASSSPTQRSNSRLRKTLSDALHSDKTYATRLGLKRLDRRESKGESDVGEPPWK